MFNGPIIPTYVGPDTPTSPISGQVWLDSNTNKSYVYLAPFWVEFTVDAEHIELSDNSAEEAYDRAMKIL